MEKSQNSVTRWIKFNLVGGIGIVIQLASLYLLTALGLNYLFATALAVEVAVIHNFVWHTRFTWADRTRADGLDEMQQQVNPFVRLLRFNIANGAISLIGNLVLMRLLVGQVHLPAIPANLMSIAACSLLNFLVSDRWVFTASIPNPVEPYRQSRAEVARLKRSAV